MDFGHSADSGLHRLLLLLHQELEEQRETGAASIEPLVAPAVVLINVIFAREFRSGDDILSKVHEEIVLVCVVVSKDNVQLHIQQPAMLCVMITAAGF